MAARLMLVAHAATSATRRAAFPVDEAIEGLETIGPVQLRAGMWLSGPELRCRQTAGGAGLGAESRSTDSPTWTPAGGPASTCGELMAAEPESVMAWMTDVTAAPHGGESLQDLVTRVGGALDGGALGGRPWPDGLSVVVAAPLVIRAALVHLLGHRVRCCSRWTSSRCPRPTSPVTGAAGSCVRCCHGGRWNTALIQPVRDNGRHRAVLDRPPGRVGLAPRRAARQRRSGWCRRG